MVNINRIFVLVACVLSAVDACWAEGVPGDNNPIDQNKPSTEGQIENVTMAIVNGTPITQNMVDGHRGEAAYIRGRLDTNRRKRAVLDELITETLLSQEAIRGKLHEKPEVVAELETARRAVLARAAMQAYLQRYPLTDEELNQLYESRKGSLWPKEYKILQFVTDTKEQAKAVVRKLDGGVDVSKLARDYSLNEPNQRSGKQGWVTLVQVPKEVANIMEGMEAGTYSKTPVRTEHGWHVIFLEAVRESRVPNLKDVKNGVRRYAEKLRLGAYIARLKREGAIEIRSQ